MAPEKKINLTLEELRDKSNLREAFVLSFEYLLTGVAKEYSEIFDQRFLYGNNNLAGFNKKNDLNLSSIIAYPFFIALANGHSEALFNLYGPFLQSTFGPVSESIQNLIEDSNHIEYQGPKLKYFKIAGIENPAGIKIVDADNDLSSLIIPHIFDSIKEKIKSTNLKVSDKPECKFSELYIKNYRGDFFPLYAAIDSGIMAIKDQSYKTFFNASIKSIMIQSRNYPAFQRDAADNKSVIINYRETGSATARPFYTIKPAL